MRTYKTSKASFVKIRRDLIIRLGLIYGFIFGAIIGWEIWQNKNDSEGDLYSLIILAILIFASVLGARKAIAQQQEIWNSIEINVDDDYISRQQVRIPEVKIYRPEITVIEENKAGLWIKTADRGRIIVIPSQLDRADYLEIKETLTNWQGEEIATAKRNTKDMAIAIAYLAAFLILFLSFNIWLNFILGIGIIIYNIYTNKQIQNSVSIDPQFKKIYKRNLAITTFIVLINAFGKMYLLSAIKRIKQEVNKNPQALIFKTNYRSSDRNY